MLDNSKSKCTSCCLTFVIHKYLDGDEELLHVEDDAEDKTEDAAEDKTEDAEDKIQDADEVKIDAEESNIPDEGSAEDTNTNSVEHSGKAERYKKIKKLKDLVEKKEETRGPKAINRKEKKTKLEKSLEILNKGFKDVAEKETDRFIKLEEMCHKQDLEYQLKLRELENQRRREERQHELAIFQLLSQPPQQARYTHPSIPFASPFQGFQDRNFAADSMSVSGSSISDGDNTYYQQL